MKNKVVEKLIDDLIYECTSVESAYKKSGTFETNQIGFVQLDEISDDEISIIINIFKKLKNQPNYNVKSIFKIEINCD